MGNQPSQPSWSFDTHFRYREAEKSDGCDIKNNREIFVKECKDWPAGWIASQDLADNYCNKAPSKPVGSTAKVKGTQVWAEWEVYNNCAYNDNRFTYPEAAHTKECTAPAKRKMSQQCKNWPAGWVASGDVVNLCKRNAPARSTVGQFGFDVWAEWIMDDPSCEPGWADASWKQEGCLENGHRRYTRRVDTKGMDWDVAADWHLARIGIGQNIPDIGIVTDKKKEKQAFGMWIVIHVDRKDCFNYPEQPHAKECVSVGKRKMSQQCKNWPGGWIASGNVVAACQRLKPANSTPLIAGADVWAEWTQDDEGCIPDWADPEWKDEGCLDNGHRKYTRKVDAKGMDWDMAGDIVLSKVPVGTDIPNVGKVTESRKEKSLLGVWIVIHVDRQDCFNYPDPPHTKECVSDGKRKMSQQCKNWPGGWIASDNVVAACQRLKPANSTPLIAGVDVWAEWTQDDESCKKTPATQPPTIEPPSTQPPAEQPPAEQPPAEQPPTTQPPTTQPPTTQPPTTQPTTTQPTTTQPRATQPPATQPPATQPRAIQPPATQPRAIQPSATQPSTTQPPATQQPPTTEETPSTEIFSATISVSIIVLIILLILVIGGVFVYNLNKQ